MSNKFFVVYKESREYDSYDIRYESDINILAVCDNPQKTLEILQNELNLCKKHKIPKEKCYLFVKIFDNLNQVTKKNTQKCSYPQFKKMIKILF